MSKYILNFPLRAPPLLCVLRGNVPSTNDARRDGRKRVKNGGWLRFAQRHREDGGGGTSPPCTEEKFEALAVLSNYLQDADSSSADGTEGQEGNCFPVPCTEGMPRGRTAMQWGSAGLRQREEAVLQPQSDSKTNKEGVISET